MRSLLAMGVLLVIGMSACSGREGTPDRGSSAEAEAVPKLNPGAVPADLQDLVPLAQRWGIGDDVARSERIQSATESEKSELRNAFAPKQARITAWLDSFGQEPMPEEAAAFMYAQLAIEEMR